MARALRCDFCRKYVEVSDASARGWMTLQIFPSVKADENEDYTEHDFCSAAHATAFMLGRAGQLGAEDLGSILEAAQHKDASHAWLLVDPRDVTRLRYETERLVRFVQAYQTKQ
jgi:hypothetical protein